MSTVILAGSLFNTSQERICDGLVRLEGRQFGTASVQCDGDEVAAKTGRARLSFQPLRAAGSFSVEGEFSGPLEEARRWLGGFARQMGRLGIPGEYDLWEESQDGWTERSMPLVS